jgi:hypothetical protein
MKFEIDHDYLSTACYHGFHERCRLMCKFCNTLCHCNCHQELQNTSTSSLEARTEVLQSTELRG